MNGRIRALAGICILTSACSGYGSWAQTAGNGGAAGAPPAAGAGGTGDDAGGMGGSGGEPTVTAGAGGSGGSGGSASTTPAFCPDNGRDTIDLLAPETEPVILDPLDAGAPPDAADGGGVSEPPGFTLPGLVGWAAHPGAGVATTTGGAAGRVVTARTAAELQAFAESAEPLVIRICGTVRAPAVRVSSNKTLVGVGENPTLEGALAIRGSADSLVQNVVVKNLRVNAASSTLDGAGILVDKAHHVWIDHSEIFDAVDGLLKVVHAADFVTVSWTKFHFTPETPDLEHRFACLIGDSDDNAEEDAEHLRVTLHHNWWAEFIRQRAPRVRFGDVHLFNNYWSSAGNDYSIWAAVGSRLLLENNYFHGVMNPHEIHDPDGQLLSRNNIYDGTSGKMQHNGSDFVPPYPYVAEAPLGLGTAVQLGAGPK